MNDVPSLLMRERDETDAHFLARLYGTIAEQLRFLADQQDKLATAQADARALALAIHNAPNIRVFGDDNYSKMITDELADAMNVYGTKYLAPEGSE